MPNTQPTHRPVWYPLLLIGPGLLAVFVALTADVIGLGTPGSGFQPAQAVLLTIGLVASALGSLIHRKAAGDASNGKRSYWKTVTFCAIPLLGLVLAWEVGSRIYVAATRDSLDHRRAFNRQWHSVVSNQFYQAYDGDYPYLPYRVRPQNSSDTNLKGYRGADFTWNKPNDTIRVACIGGSTTWEGRLPSSLQAELNRQASAGDGHRFEVLNFGAESWTTVESLINYSVRGVHAQPDYVVIYHAINDVVAASHPKHIRPQPDYSHWRKRLRRPPSNMMTGVPLIFDRAAAVCLIRNILYRNQAEHTWANSICNYPFAGNQEFQGTSTFRNNIENLVATALQHGATAVLVTQVHSPEHSRRKCGNDSAIERVALMNEVLRDVAGRQTESGRVLLVDAAKAAPRLKLYSEMHDWCHFSETGYTRLAHFIAQQIMPR